MTTSTTRPPARPAIGKARDAGVHPVSPAAPMMTPPPLPPAEPVIYGPPAPAVAVEPEPMPAATTPPPSRRRRRIQWSTRVWEDTADQVEAFLQALPVHERRGVIQDLTDRGLILALQERERQARRSA